MVETIRYVLRRETVTDVLQEPAVVKESVQPKGLIAHDARWSLLGALL
ncbi:MAG: hypothetical protein WCE63_13165 [Acidobacteriaceae bacterium]